jgi:hypothetical protein
MNNDGADDEESATLDKETTVHKRSHCCVFLVSLRGLFLLCLLFVRCWGLLGGAKRGVGGNDSLTDEAMARHII